MHLVFFFDFFPCQGKTIFFSNFFTTFDKQMAHKTFSCTIFRDTHYSILFIHWCLISFCYFFPTQQKKTRKTYFFTSNDLRAFILAIMYWLFLLNLQKFSRFLFLKRFFTVNNWGFIKFYMKSYLPEIHYFIFSKCWY